MSDNCHLQKKFITSPNVPQFVLQPARHFQVKSQEEFRKRYVWLTVKRAKDGFGLFVHRWIDATLAASKALCTRVLPDFAKKTLAWIEPETDITIA